jgi:nucleotide-binding universal stress UspA family protein
MSNSTILVPYDFTEEAECALNHAAGLAKIHNSKIVIHHVVDKKSLSNLRHDHRSILDLDHEFTEFGKNANEKYGVEIETLLKEGDIFTAIPEVAESTDASLIVFGTHGVRGMQHLIGAFALKLVTSAKVPVIIVQRRPIRATGYKTIIYPVDENPYSKQKAYSVAAFAKENNSTVLLLPKLNSDSHFQNYTDGNLRYSEKVFEEENVQFQSFVNDKHGSFSKQVIDFAAKHDADIIAITTQDSDDRDVGDIFVGSEDVRIINNEAEIPTLCINAVVSLKVGGLSGVTGS